MSSVDPPSEIPLGSASKRIRTCHLQLLGALVGEFQDGVVYRLRADELVADTRGGKGEGPGEFGALDAILLEGDTIVVSDGRLRRLTLFSPDGQVRTSPIPGAFLYQASALLSPSEGNLLSGLDLENAHHSAV